MLFYHWFIRGVKMLSVILILLAIPSIVRKAAIIECNLLNNRTKCIVSVADSNSFKFKRDRSALLMDEVFSDDAMNISCKTKSRKNNISVGDIKRTIFLPMACDFNHYRFPVFFRYQANTLKNNTCHKYL